LVKASSVLELGTFTGYATLCLAEGVAEAEAVAEADGVGRVVTCETDKRSADLAQKYFAECEFGQMVSKMYCGTLPSSTPFKPSSCVVIRSPDSVRKGVCGGVIESIERRRSKVRYVRTFIHTISNQEE
jgi:hypothetical protein